MSYISKYQGQNIDDILTSAEDFLNNTSDTLASKEYLNQIADTLATKSELNTNINSVNASINSLTNTVNTKTTKSEVYPVGSIYSSTSSTSPASLFGGTWTLWKRNCKYKQLTVSKGNDSEGLFTINSTNCSDYEITSIALNNWLWTRFVLTLKVALTDSTINYGTLNRKVMGYDGGWTHYVVGASDDGNNACYMRVNSNGTVSSYDRVVRTDIAADNTIVFEVIEPITDLLDEYTGLYMWKRIA